MDVTEVLAAYDDMLVAIIAIAGVVFNVWAVRWGWRVLRQTL